MTRHVDDTTLQDFLEGLLDSETEGTVRVHLESCPTCRREVEILSELRRRVGALPVEARPSRDLWPQIAWRMEGSKKPTLAAETDSLQSEPSAPAPSDAGRKRWVSLPAWQLLAASIALMVVSGTTVWAVLGRGGEGTVPLPSVSRNPAQMVSFEEVYGGYEEAVVDLETVLERGREVLDPETVQVLEESLNTIDAAIQEARDALEDDPASAILQRFLVDNLTKKVDLLRQAAAAVYAIT